MVWQPLLLLTCTGLLSAGQQTASVALVYQLGLPITHAEYSALNMTTVEVEIGPDWSAMECAERLRTAVTCCSVLVTNLEGWPLRLLAISAQHAGATLVSTREKMPYEGQPAADREDTWISTQTHYNDNTSVSSILALTAIINQEIATKTELQFTVDILILVDSQTFPDHRGGVRDKVVSMYEDVLRHKKRAATLAKLRLSPFEIPRIHFSVLNFSDSLQVVQMAENARKLRADVISPYGNDLSTLFNLVSHLSLNDLGFSKLWLVAAPISHNYCASHNFTIPRNYPIKLILQCEADVVTLERLPGIISNALTTHETDRSNNRSVRQLIREGLHEDASDARRRLFFIRQNPDDTHLSRSYDLLSYPTRPLASAQGILCMVRGLQSYGCTPHNRKARLKILGIYNPPYWLQSERDIEDGCEGMGYFAEFFSQVSEVTAAAAASSRGVRRQEAASRYHCVDGFSLELIKKLGEDASFKYTIKILNQSNLTGADVEEVAQLIVDGRMDVLMGQISETVKLKNRVSFSVPYRYDGLCIVVQQKFQSATIDSFLKPLNIWMLFSIGMGVHIAAIAITHFEWCSPYGLTPRGRNRRKVFSFPSALLLCWSILLGHTVDTSTPKSWSSRWLMNVWAALSVYFLASYTAKLAVYMIGRTTYLDLSGINDYRISSGEVVVGTVRDSDVHRHLNTLYADKIGHLMTTASVDEAIEKLGTGEMDAFVWQKGVMEHIVTSSYNCRLMLVGDTFAHVGYSLMFQKDAIELNTWFNKYLEIYHSNMDIEDMLDKWRKGASCSSQQIIGPQLSISHTMGVFLMLLIGVGIGLLCNLAEHLTARMIGCCTGNQTCIDISHPLSQRLHRSLRCEQTGTPGLRSITRSINHFWSPTNRGPTHHGRHTVISNYVACESMELAKGGTEDCSGVRTQVRRPGQRAQSLTGESLRRQEQPPQVWPGALLPRGAPGSAAKWELRRRDTQDRTSHNEEHAHTLEAEDEGTDPRSSQL